MLVFNEAKFFTGIGLSEWDTSSVINMESMFASAIEFNEDIYFLKNQSAWRAKQYASWVLDPSNLEMLHVASPASGMFQGDHGIVMFLSQMLQDGWPNDVQHCMPGWNSCV